MTQIKIPFTKTKIETIPADKLDAGCKGVELEISTNFKMGEGLGIDLSKCHGGTPENTFAKMFFVFKDGSESNLYNDLLDSSKTNFELSFDTEKVFLMVGGFCNFIDKTKPEVQVYPAPNSRKMGVFFESKFSGIITLKNKVERERERDENGPNGPNNHQPTPQEIDNLKNKLDQVKNDKQKLQEVITEAKKINKDVLKKNRALEDSLKAAEIRLKDLEKTQVEKGFWKKEIVIPIILILMVVVFIGIFFWVRKRKKEWT